MNYLPLTLPIDSALGLVEMCLPLATSVAQGGCSSVENLVAGTSTGREL